MSMWKYVLQRILLIFITAVIILCITYILLQTIPYVKPSGTFDIQKQYWDEQVRLKFWENVTDDKVAIANGWYNEHISDGLGHDFYYRQLPLMTRFWNWFVNIITQWNWGTSLAISPNHSAVEIEMGYLPVSMRLNIFAMIISIPCGLALGILAALRKDTWVDNTISTVIMFFISVPSFVSISFMMIWFCYQNKWLPTQFPNISDSTADPLLAIRGYVIPIAALCVGSIASFARWTRAELTEVMSSEFLLLARTKGLTKPQTVVRHALRNSMVPIVPMIIGEFVGILSGSMVLETLYGIPGIGSLFVRALNGKDYSVVMVDMAIYTLIGLFATLVVDLSYGIVDPRIRMGARK
jgi:oligopeptide transport system permease protein